MGKINEVVKILEKYPNSVFISMQLLRALERANEMKFIEKYIIQNNWWKNEENLQRKIFATLYRTENWKVMDHIYLVTKIILFIPAPPPSSILKMTMVNKEVCKTTPK